LGKNSIPLRDRRAVIKAAVDDAPAAFAVIQQPDVDVIQREGQRKPRPV